MEEWEFKSLIEKFYSSLTGGSKREYLMLFSDLQIQIEGWFRGELMNFLRNNNIDITVKNRESRINDETRKKADLKLEFTNEIYWIELKHLLVGCQLNNTYPLGFYFNKNSYIYNDIKKLQEVDNSDKRQHRYSLAFISTNYTCDKCRNTKFKKIITKEELKVQYKDIIKNKTDIKQKASLVSWDYNNIQHLGYLLLRVNNKEGVSR